MLPESGCAGDQPWIYPCSDHPLKGVSPERGKFLNPWKETCVKKTRVTATQKRLLNVTPVPLCQLCLGNFLHGTSGNPRPRKGPVSLKLLGRAC